jgi:hypothetical protein
LRCSHLRNFARSGKPVGALDPPILADAGNPDLVRAGRRPYHSWMRRLLLPAWCAVGVMPRAAAAQEVALVSEGPVLEWVAVRVPLATEQLGAIAAVAVDRVQAGSAGQPAGALWGEAPGGAPGADWASRPLQGARRSKAPLGALGRDGRCSCATEIGDSRRERVAALFAQVVFTAGDEVERTQSLELRARYSDGMVVHLNGVEVARRGIGSDADSMETARAPRGREWETFYLPAAGLLRRGENRLAIEVRPHRYKRAPSLDLALVARAGGPRVVRGPIVQWLAGGGAAITFDTDLPARASVELAIGQTTPVMRRSNGGALAVRHRIELAALPPGAPVRYRVRAGGDALPEMQFHAPPAAGAPLRFAVYGDTRNGHRVHAQIARSVLEEAPAFVVTTGDHVVRGTDEGDWQAFFAIAGEVLARLPFYPVAGNHDLGRAGDEERRMNEILALPRPTSAQPAAATPEWAHWYSFDVAGVHMVVLDSNSYEHQAQLDWLRADLAAARAAGARAIFAAVHHGPFSRGPHGGSRIARDSYLPLLVEHRIALLFAGHDHIYQRGEKDGLPYFVSGGGGAPLYPIKCGSRGRPRCREPDGASHAASEHHYLVVTVHQSHIEVCPRRPDRTPLEKCVQYKR